MKPGSSADIAGLRAGDYVLELDAEPCLGQTAKELSAQINKVSDRVALSLCALNKDDLAAAAARQDELA